ncbi:TetR/AcrR family transcriptional regulator [Kitasatospora sp. GP82]|uniref:TetR/AcrR family transcriptional regulator n=1 Tax=Kitasatospora sp. GP82 TaxID=3035089 RepID=UPI0024762C6A|nr:TetR/AcrR family transcriptional regulator [Kitasatospora sp. GP82]MDH6125227.1 AcrR family transcriptional regulator [Kitasatospora sp. GP82]
MEQRGQADVRGRRAMRADSERTVKAILAAAERVLRRDPSATIEQIAAEAGVARTTVHRRFATREALIEALGAWATRELAHAVDRSHPEHLPPLVALHQVTANVLEAKISWSYGMGRPTDPESDRIRAEVLARCDALFHRARQSGLLRPDTDLDWLRRVYYVLISEAVEGDPTNRPPAALATLVVNTLLHGAGTNSTAL